MNGFKTSTAGTLLTRFDSTAVIADRTGVVSRLSLPTAAIISGVSTFASSAATTMNRPANMRSSGQSISR